MITSIISGLDQFFFLHCTADFDELKVNLTFAEVFLIFFIFKKNTLGMIP